MIPKPGTTEQRPLGIPCLIERAKQVLVKLALEPEWEAVFEPSTYGFRSGRGAHDAIEAIFLSIKHKSKYVLDADILKCFDKINQEKLLDKLNTFPKLSRQIKAWLKSGVVMDGRLFPTNEGTPQGGNISPLLALIALHGLETAIRGCLSQSRKVQKELTVVLYADDFVVLHKSLETIQKCQLAAQAWLQEMSLELKPSKTRISHTLTPYEGSVGFDFLGFVRHEVAYMAVMTEQSGHNLVFCYQYSTKTCGWSNLTVRSSWDNAASSHAMVITPARENYDYKHQRGRELGLDGTANKSELLLNVVRKEQAKGADRLEPKGNMVGTEAESSSVADNQHHRRMKQSLTHLGMDVERGKPIVLPAGTANRKVSLWDCG